MTSPKGVADSEQSARGCIVNMTYSAATPLCCSDFVRLVEFVSTSAAPRHRNKEQA